MIDKGRVLYGDDRAGKGLMAYTPPSAPVVFRDGFGFSTSIFADGQASYYVATFSAPLPPRAKVFENFPHAGFLEKYAYDNANAEAGRLFGNTSELFFTAYDYSSTTGGVVARLSDGAARRASVGGNTQQAAVRHLRRRHARLLDQSRRRSQHAVQERQPCKLRAGGLLHDAHGDVDGQRTARGRDR